MSTKKSKKPSSNSKPVEPKRTGSRSYDSFKQKQYESKLKDWEKEQAKQGIMNGEAVAKAQKEQRKAEERVAELTSIGSLDVSDALQYQSKSSSKKFKFENVLDDIKVNANNIYEQRRQQDLPGKLGSRSRSGGFKELRNKIKTIAKEAGQDYRDFYDQTTFTGGKIGRSETLRIRKDINRADSDNDFEPVDTSKDVYGVQSIQDLADQYNQVPTNLQKMSSTALATINRQVKANGAQKAAAKVRAKIGL